MSNTDRLKDDFLLIDYIRKLIQFIVFYPIYYIVVFGFFGQEILKNEILVGMILLYFLINLIDIFLDQ